MKELVFRNRRVIMCEVVSILEISLESVVQCISKDSLNLHHIATKFMSCLLRRTGKRIVLACASTGALISP
jgi:hypothetical protein